VAAFSVLPGGHLSPSGSLPTGSLPHSLAVDPSGRFVYVANAQGNTLSALAIDAETGGLTTVGAPTATDLQPGNLAIGRRPRPASRAAFSLPPSMDAKALDYREGRSTIRSTPARGSRSAGAAGDDGRVRRRQSSSKAAADASPQLCRLRGSNNKTVGTDR